jgi:hypothetical protein
MPSGSRGRRSPAISAVQDTELVAFRIGQHGERLRPGLTDVDACGAQRDQAGHLAVVLTAFEAVVALLQAYVFTMLTASYVEGALAEGH